MSYTYRITAENLTAVLKDDKSISFYDSEKYAAAPEKAEAEFIIHTPNMYDTAGAVSYDIAVKLGEVDREYVLTYTPNFAWLKDNSRKYPVTVDPTVTVKSGVTDCYTDGSTAIDMPSHHYVGKNGRGYLYLRGQLFGFIFS